MEKKFENTQQSLLTAIEQSLNGLRFGSVEIVVHEGKVSHIERRERLRTNLTKDVQYQSWKIDG